MEQLGRKPPVEVRRKLRREVGYGCPVKYCGNPYLEYHHFDPQWHIKRHHDPKGMIALCATHHAKADALTREQCLDLKSNSHTRDVKGRFEWMRREIVSIIGGNYYHEVPIILRMRDMSVIWWERDQNGYLQLSLQMLTVGNEPRTRLMANDWDIRGNPIDVESPPNGSLLSVRYENGDYLSIKFREWKSSEQLQATHPRILDLEDFGETIVYPLVTAEVNMEVAGTDIRLDPKGATIQGISLRGCLSSRSQVGLSLQ